MFNSTLIRDYGSVLENAIWERQEEIFNYTYELWLDVEAAEGDVFDRYFAPFFPAGFIDRDKERAKKVIRDLRDIIQSPVVRHNPDAIYCYVMYSMINVWFDDEYTQTLDLVPDDVKAVIASLEEKEKKEEIEARNNGSLYDEYDDPPESERIRLWFTDKDSCLGDFEDIYDSDYMDETIAEAAAEIYLSSTGIPDDLGIDIKELVDLLPNDLYEKVIEKLKRESSEKENAADQYVDTIWPRIESFFQVLSHAGFQKKSSFQGAQEILWNFKDWVENNGGWKDVQNAESKIKETAIHRLIMLGAKTYLKSQNLDMNCECNIGVGQEDFKISRGNDKTVIEVKLTSNPTCRHGYERQLPRYAEAEHTENMIFCLVDNGNTKIINEIKELHKKGEEERIPVPELIVIDANPQKSASIRKNT